MAEIINPCENCGGTNFVHATPENRKGALTRVHVNPGETLHFQGDAGTPVDIYACGDCGCIRLFGITRQ